MGVAAATIVWTVVVLTVAFLGIWKGYSGARFATALAVAAILFGFDLFLAAPRVQNFVIRSLGGRAAVLAPLVPLGAVILYCLAVNPGWKVMLAVVVYALVPPLIASASKQTGASVENYIALACLAVPLLLPPPYRFLYYVFSYPAPLTHTFAILMAVSVGIATFVVPPRLEGIGYAIEWRRGFLANFLLHFLIFAAIAIPLGMKMHFLTYNPSLPPIRAIGLSGIAALPLSALGILFFTAWPEEFLFRGLLQNLLSRSMKSDWAGLLVAAIIFGFSHIFHAPFPNWKYVLLAIIAGLFYGHAWIKTRSLIPGVLIHALVDTTWHILFR